MKLFRELRKHQIDNRKIKKYLIYALGEIFLVMVGISLAFQLDNWNETRIKKNTEINHYRNIKSQIIDDHELIQSQLDFNNRFMAEFKYINSIIETNDRSKMDTLGSILLNLTEYSDFDRHGNIYETMVNSGEIKILRNHEIIEGIRELEERYIYVNRIESIHYDAVMKHIADVIIPLVSYATGEVKQPDVVFNYKFQNLLIALLDIMIEKDKTYRNALIQIQEVKQLIDKELLINVRL